MHLFAHGNSNTAIAAATPHDAMHSPGAGEGYESGVEITVNLEGDAVHLEGNEGGRIAPAVHVRLVTGNIRVINDGRVLDDSVEHGSGGEIGGGRLLHGGYRLRRRHGTVLAEVNPLGEAEAVLDGVRELLRHKVVAVGTEEEEESGSGGRRGKEGEG